MILKNADINTLTYFLTKIKALLATKSDINHTHEYVNGIKPVVSTTRPTVDDRTILTFIK